MKEAYPYVMVFGFLRIGIEYSFPFRNQTVPIGNFAK